MNETTLTPTKNVALATLVSAVIGLLAWIFEASDVLVIPPGVVGMITTLVVGAIGYARHSAKVAAGAMAAALVGVLGWAASTAGIEFPPAAVAYLNTIALFIFAWVTTEFTDTDDEPITGA